MAHRSTIAHRCLNALTIMLGGLLLAACAQTTAFATEPRAVPTHSQRHANSKTPSPLRHHHRRRCQSNFTRNANPEAGSYRHA